jgi:hypothetical protein
MKVAIVDCVLVVAPAALVMGLVVLVCWTGEIILAAAGAPLFAGWLFAPAMSEPAPAAPTPIKSTPAPMMAATLLFMVLISDPVGGVIPVCWRSHDQLSES